MDLTHQIKENSKMGKKKKMQWRRLTLDQKTQAQWKYRKWGHTNINQNRVGMMLISDKRNFKSKIVEKCLIYL